MHIRVARLDDSTLIEVKDNGIGMDQEQVELLLQPTIRAKGGIGVSNTNRRLTQMYGQGLSVISKPDVGTTVFFLVPDGSGPQAE